MDNLEKLLDEIQNDGISVNNVSSSIEAASLKLKDSESNDRYAIFFNQRLCNNTKEKYVKVAHEYAHIKTGALYDFKTSQVTKQKAEYKANKYMIQRLVPIEKFKEALMKEMENWELAEEFEVTEEIIKKAIEMYTFMNLI